ncbi:2-C-methyl-D-erythritol 4-phosphate cytidylyltransferase [Rickettsiales bacterium]|nr:2-C-methyl-D-erythritol 4-phosphate cytidylyltransferase [Rickettsiales bacterium]
MAIAIILAAGSSSRFKHRSSKLFMKFADKQVIEIIIDKFLAITAFTEIILVHNDNANFDIVKNQYGEKLSYVEGGTTRQESVKNALNSISCLENEKILIHDAARFNCSTQLIEAVITKLDHHQATIPILPVIDTVKKLNKQNNQILETIDRSELGLAQTPQGFQFAVIKKLHNKNQDFVVTDDASLLEQNNIPINYIEGEKNNFKITEFADYELAQKLLPCPQHRHSNGYDLHRFSEEPIDTDIILGGIKIPHNRRLIAHSDGDVLLHSLTDAVLGLCSGSDIGELFPDNKSENKDRDSIDFIKRAIEIAAMQNIRVTYIDITIILELPKLSPYKISIRDNIAKVFDLKKEEVNIKATTNEKIGDIGQGKAIAVLSTLTAILT